MTKIERMKTEDLEKLKAHFDEMRKIMEPYALTEEVVNLEESMIEGYKKLHAYKTKMLSVQKAIGEYAFKLDCKIKENMSHD